ncbi:hypothetical protein QL285_017300 [Trifolium repens]|nr:hypothetical protein QL285_017300 [Trifolium repens]
MRHEENNKYLDATEAEGSKQSRTEKKMMPRMEKQDQGSKLSRTEKKSQKDATEAEGSKQRRTEKKMMPLVRPKIPLYSFSKEL